MANNHDMGNSNTGIFGIVNSLISVVAGIGNGLSNYFIDGNQAVKIKEAYERGDIIAPIYIDHKGRNIEVYLHREVYLRNDCGHMCRSFKFDGECDYDYTYEYIHKQYLKRKEAFKRF